MIYFGFLAFKSNLDSGRLLLIYQPTAFLVTRAKCRYSRPVDGINAHIVCDQIGVLTAFYFSKDYPAPLHRAVVKDETRKRIMFSINHFVLEPTLIAGLCRQRWQA